MLQIRYEPHLSDKAQCSEAFQFSITKIWHAYINSHPKCKPKSCFQNFFEKYMKSDPIKRVISISKAEATVLTI